MVDAGEREEVALTRPEPGPPPEGHVEQGLSRGQEQEVAHADPPQRFARPETGRVAREPGGKVEVLGEEEAADGESAGRVGKPHGLEAFAGQEAQALGALHLVDRVVVPERERPRHHPPEKDERGQGQASDQGDASASGSGFQAG